MTGILLMVACHRLVVGSTDNDTHLVGHLGVFRVISIERPTPHSRPEEIALQTEDEFEHLLIETVVAIAGTESVLHPRCQAGRLIVEEDAAILDSRLTVRVFTSYYI